MSEIITPAQEVSELQKEKTAGERTTVILSQLGINHELLTYGRFKVSPKLGGYICETSDGLQVHTEYPRASETGNDDDMDSGPTEWQEVNNATYMVQTSTEDGKNNLFITVSQEADPRTVLKALLRFVAEDTKNKIEENIQQLNQEERDRDEQESTSLQATAAEISSHPLFSLASYEIASTIADAAKINFPQFLLQTHREIEKWKFSLEQSIEAWREWVADKGGLQKQVEQGEVMLNFEGKSLRGVSQCFVVDGDGALRPPDKEEFVGHRSKDNRDVSWQQVGPTDLALRWTTERTDRNPPGRGQFEVIKRPAELTPVQIQAVRVIETQNLNAYEGAFGLDPKQNEMMQAVLKEVQQKIQSFPNCFYSIPGDAISYGKLIDADGVFFEGDYETDEEIERLVDPGRFPTIPFDRCTAHIVGQATLTNGQKLVGLVYEKGGHWNMVVRLEQGVAVQKTKTENKTEGSSPSAAADLSGFADLFNKDRGKDKGGKKKK